MQPARGMLPSAHAANTRRTQPHVHVLVAPFGTEGDVRPLVAFAQAMAARGHRISFLANPHFARLLAPDFSLIPVGTEASFDEDADSERIWRPVAGAFMFLRLVERALHQTFAALEGARFDLVAGNTVSIAAMTWAEHARIPRLVMHVQPMTVRSRGDVPLLARGLEWTTRLSPRGAAAWFRAIDAATRPMLIPINAYRRRQGLRTIRSFDALLQNAEGLAALYPAWLARPQRDWPERLRQFGVLRDVQGGAGLPPVVERFLAHAKPPYVWTQGS
jgi:UDP:flavonoid glycosyltransferase YjiC (YdhE family)